MPPDLRLEIFTLAAARLDDSIAKVRANAIKCLTRWVETAPYIVFKRDNGKINEALFRARLEEIKATIEVKVYTYFFKARPDYDASIVTPADVDMTSENLDPDATAATDISLTTDEQDLKKLQALSRYYTDGLALCVAVGSTILTMLQLLSSSKKSDIVESVNFHATCCMFGMDCAEPGMRAMVHRVWEKEVSSIKEVAKEKDGVLVMSAEASIVGVSIREHLARTYRDIYLVIYPPGGEVEDAIAAANNLIK